MRAKSEALAQQFEAKAREAVALVDQVQETDWKKVAAAEQWTVGVTAHHLASAFETVAGIVTAMVAGQPRRDFTRAMLDALNAGHAKEHAGCTKAETLALLRKGASKTAGVIRGLTDEQLTKSETVFTDAPPMTVEQLVTLALIGHSQEHCASIRSTVGG